MWTGSFTRESDGSQRVFFEAFAVLEVLDHQVVLPVPVVQVDVGPHQLDVFQRQPVIALRALHGAVEAAPVGEVAEQRPCCAEQRLLTQPQLGKIEHHVAVGEGEAFEARREPRGQESADVPRDQLGLHAVAHANFLSRPPNRTPRPNLSPINPPDRRMALYVAFCPYCWSRP
jgi:hypothetical protein